MVAVRTYNVLTVLARQNNTLCCFEKTLLVPIRAFPRLSGGNCRDYTTKRAIKVAARANNAILQIVDIHYLSVVR